MEKVIEKLKQGALKKQQPEEKPNGPISSESLQQYINESKQTTQTLNQLLAKISKYEETMANNEFNGIVTEIQQQIKTQETSISQCRSSIDSLKASYELLNSTISSYDTTISKIKDMYRESSQSKEDTLNQSQADDTKGIVANLQSLLNQQSISLLETQSRINQFDSDFKNMNIRLNDFSKRTRISEDEVLTASSPDQNSIALKIEKANVTISMMLRKMDTFATINDLNDLSNKYNTLTSFIKAKDIDKDALHTQAHSYPEAISYQQNLYFNEAISKMNAQIDIVSKSVGDYQSRLNELYYIMQTSSTYSPSFKNEQHKPANIEVYPTEEIHMTQLHTPPGKNLNVVTFDAGKKHQQSDNSGYSNMMALLQPKQTFLRKKSPSRSRENAIDNKLAEMKSSFLKK